MRLSSLMDQIGQLLRGAVRGVVLEKSQSPGHFLIFICFKGWWVGGVDEVVRGSLGQSETLHILCSASSDITFLRPEKLIHLIFDT